MNLSHLFHDSIGLPEDTIPLSVTVKRPMTGKIGINKEYFEDKVNELIKNEVSNQFVTDWRDNRLCLFLKDPNRNNFNSNNYTPNADKSWKGYIGCLLFGYDLFENYDFKKLEVKVFYYKKYCVGNNYFNTTTLSYKDQSIYCIPKEELEKLAKDVALSILNTSTGFLSKDNREEK